MLIGDVPLRLSKSKVVFLIYSLIAFLNFRVIKEKLHLQVAKLIIIIFTRKKNIIFW